MIRSMTGFGEARREADSNAYHLELRSVNNRYFKSAVRLPEDFAFLEGDLERLLRERLTRGSVYLRLSVRNLSAEAAYELNGGALQAYVQQLRAAAGGDQGVTIDLATLATLPGVVQPREVSEAEREQRWEVAAELTRAALDRLVEMRDVEGAALAADLQSHCTAIREHIAAIRPRVPLVVQEFRDRLHDRVKELIAHQNVRLAEEDLIREVSIYAERSDISEELSRLTGHIEQFEAVMAGEEAAGRKLEFLAQEMLREANTMGSKSGDVELARHIIDIKSSIDRIKEQVQNVE